MATQVQFRRGTGAQNNAFTGATGELTVNTTNKSVHVHDGTTVGGFELARTDLSNTSNLSLSGLTSISTLYVSGISTFVGAVTFQGGTITLGDADTDNVVFTADVNSSILPNTNNSYDLGSSSQQWKNIYSSGISSLTNVYISGITTTNNKVHVGSSSTFTETLVVTGDARITGILSIGTGTITLDPSNNSIKVGTGITINASTSEITVAGAKIADNSGNANYVGVVTATTFSGNLANALTLNTSGTGLSGSTSFNNSGATTFTVTSNATSNNTNSTIVSRDSSGNFSAGTITANLTGTATTATKLATARTFEITGDVVASAISFDGSGNVSLAATIQPNSVGLGTDTTGDYVTNITGTSNQITVTSGTGEGSTPTLSIPSQFTAPQDVTVTRDLQVNRNLNVNGNITIGGTSAFIAATELKVYDPDIVIGVRTDGSGNDVSTDNTANHGGIAIASTEGTPLISLYDVGIGETNPATYKKFMWFKSGTFSGLGTDAWISNYAIGIGSTQVPNGVRLAAGNVQFTQNDLTVVRNINASGICTALDFNTTSDINFKTNVHSIENPLEKVLQINGVEFNWKEDNRPSMGVIAQEIEKVLPQLVNDGERKTVNYNGIIALLIEGLKDQQKQIDELKKRIDTL